MKFYDRSVLVIPTPTTFSECDLINTEIEADGNTLVDLPNNAGMEIHTLEDFSGGDDQ